MGAHLLLKRRQAQYSLTSFLLRLRHTSNDPQLLEHSQSVPGAKLSLFALIPTLERSTALTFRLACRGLAALNR